MGFRTTMGKPVLDWVSILADFARGSPLGSPLVQRASAAESRIYEIRKNEWGDAELE
jgi:hypothetical protein